VGALHKIHDGKKYSMDHSQKQEKFINTIVYSYLIKPQEDSHNYESQYNLYLELLPAHILILSNYTYQKSLED
jgi:hypothetical protein